MWCSAGRVLPVFEPCLRRLRTLPPVQRCVAAAPDPARPVRRVGQLLQHAVPGGRWPCAVGVECRGPRLDGGLLNAPEAVGARRRLRGGLGQPAVVHGRLGQEDVVLHRLLH